MCHKLYFLFMIGLTSLVGCAKYESAQIGETVAASSAIEQGPVFASLEWESTSHPERNTWSRSLRQIVKTHFEALNQAKDIVFFCPTYATLSPNNKINVWANIFASTAYYESGWNPASYSVDVGSVNNADTWSVGLLQLSVVDQQNYRFPFGFSFSDLQNPVKNLELGVAIMAKQITKHGVILIPKGQSGLYWAVLHPGGKYDKSVAIQKKMRAFCH